MVKLKIYWLRDRFIICHFFSCKMTPFWSHCSPSLPFRTDQTNSTRNKSGNSRPRHHDLLPMIPLMDWWIGEQVFCMLGLYKRQSRAEARGGIEDGQRGERRTGKKAKQRDGETGNERKTGRDRGQKTIKQRPIQAVNP